LKTEQASQNIIIFDGVCYLCDASIRFIVRRDTHQVFEFSPLQSDFAQSLMLSHDVSHLVNDTFILVKNGKCYFQSDAALEISREFVGPWRLFRVFKIVPRPIRDFVYRVVAKHRYQLFGKAEACILPPSNIKSRFRL
jgi:predicted DCC family thiol-disulfide oxidoreductase YuxK